MVITAQLVAARAGGAAAGALLTALTSLFTGWLTRRHENQRWLLDRRLEVYAAFNSAVNALQAGCANVRVGQSDPKTLPELLPPLHNWQQQVALLAPEDVADGTLRLTLAAVNALGLQIRETTQQQHGRRGAAQAMNEFVAGYDELVKLQRRDVQGRARAIWQPMWVRIGSRDAPAGRSAPRLGSAHSATPP